MGDHLRHPREAGDVDAVRGRCGSLRDPVKEDDVLPFFADQDLKIGAPRELRGEFGEFVVVGSEEGSRAHPVVQVFDDGPREAHPIVGARAPPHLVQDHEAPGCGLGEDACDLDHLGEKRAAAGREVVGGPDPGEDAVDESHLGLPGGHEAADLRHDDDQGRLADVGAFAAEVGPGHDQDVPVVGAEHHIVRDELLAPDRLLDGGVPALGDAQDPPFRELRARIPVADGGLGECRVHVELRDRPGRGLQPVDLRADAVPELAEHFVFPGGDPFLRGQDEGLALLHLRGDVPLCADQRALSDIVRGHQMLIGLADFDVVTHHLVVADSEAPNPRPRPLGGFQPRDPLAGRAASLVEAVDLRIEPGPDHPAVLGRERRRLDQAPAERVDQVRRNCERGHKRANRGGEIPCHDRRDRRQRLEGRAEGGEIPRSPRRLSEAAAPPFDIAQALQAGAEGFARGGVRHEGVDRIEAGGDLRGIEERLLQPAPEEARPHRRLRQIEHAEERRAPAPQPERPLRGLIDDHSRRSRVEADGA